MEEVTIRSSCEFKASGLLRSLQCYFCKDKFSEPKECSCGHVFCFDCLLTYIGNEDIKSVTCPLCCRNISSNESRAEDLPTHVFYQDLACEVRALDNQKLSRGSCKFCSDSDKHMATVKCITCQVPMCQDCSANHVHNGVNTVVTIHRKQDSILCDILPKRDTPCDIHPTESVSMFCMSCQCCLCFKCKNEKHGDHMVTDLTDSALQAKAAISDIQSNLKDYLGETKDALSDIDRIGKEFADKVSATKAHIESQVDLLLNHILSEKERMLDELASHFKEVEDRLNNRQAEMQCKDSRAKVMSELTENLIHYGNDAENSQYKREIEEKWKEMQDEKLNRFGQGYRLNVQFYMNDGLLAILSKELGTFMVTQNLSPWTSRRSKPFEIDPSIKGPLDPTTLRQKVKLAMSNDFSLKRSQIFAKFVDPKWNLETYKMNSATGQTVTVWMRVDEDQEQMSRASKRISMRAVNSLCLVAEVESFNERGEHEYKKTFEKLPDGTIIRLAIGGKDTILLAVYPGIYASYIVGQAKLKSLSKKDTDGIYVAVLERGNFVCGEVRKIPIPEGPGFDFEITGRGIIVVKPLLQPNLKLYNTQCTEYVTNHSEHDIAVIKMMESPDSEIVTICRDNDGNAICESIADDGERTTRFTFPNKMLAPLNCEFRDARFDRDGNVLVHFQASGSQDILYQVTRQVHRKEYLVKPEMLHKVDNLAVLPDGRICVFDKGECVLMTLKYL